MHSFMKIILITLIFLIFYGVKKYRLSLQKIATFQKINNFDGVSKIAVIGCAGSGKTYLSVRLQEKLNLPLYHLDQYHWLPGWQRVDDQIFTKIHHDLCLQDRWIIEGIYFRHLDERVKYADMIIFLDISRYQCIWNVCKRAVFNLGKVIPGNPEGCYQDVLSYRFLEFLSWIWNFDTKHRKTIVDTFDRYKDCKNIVILHSQDEMNQFLKS